MADNKNESVVEETTKNVVEETTNKEQPKTDDKVEKIKVKKKPKMKKISQEEEITKVNLSKTKDPAEKEEEKVDDVVEEVVEEVIEEVIEDKKEEPVEEIKKEQPVIEEITTEEQEKIEEVKEEVIKAVEEAEATGKPIPENIEKLMKFMDETGGDLEDYVKLNTDISKLDDGSVLRKYYEQTKPHLTNEEINFLMEDQFSYDEEEDEERDVKRKKLALKEQVASARAHLDGQKSKYYEDIKAGSKLPPEQQKAVDFFNRYNKESEETNKVVKRNTDIFEKRTNEFFSDKFKGFEYNVGEKKYRFNVKDKNEIKENQSDLSKFMAKFVDENKALKDAKGYHKSLFTAMNPDTIAQHFYEQGKADAIKDSVAKAKNVSMEPRQSHKEVNVGGVKYKVLGDNSSDFKFKIKNKNNN